ncbi:MAG TPA: hypothetical protein VIT91_07090 [Chthoniobacterales bacterium]
MERRTNYCAEYQQPHAVDDKADFVQFRIRQRQAVLSFHALEERVIAGNGALISLHLNLTCRVAAPGAFKTE